MCAVSMVTGYGQMTWPLTQQTPYNGPSKEEWEEFKKLIIAAIEFDKKTKQPDCVDPAKQEWMDGIDAKLR